DDPPSGRTRALTTTAEHVNLQWKRGASPQVSAQNPQFPQEILALLVRFPAGQVIHQMSNWRSSASCSASRRVVLRERKYRSRLMFVRYPGWTRTWRRSR